MKKFLYSLLLLVCVTCFSATVTFAQDDDADRPVFVSKTTSATIVSVSTLPTEIKGITAFEYVSPAKSITQDFIGSSFSYNFSKNVYPVAKNVNWHLVCDDLKLQAILNDNDYRIVNPQKRC
jgi:hypothetical protein